MSESLQSSVVSDADLHLLPYQLGGTVLGCYPRNCIEAINDAITHARTIGHEVRWKPVGRIWCTEGGIKDCSDRNLIAIHCQSENKAGAYSAITQYLQDNHLELILNSTAATT